MVREKETFTTILYFPSLQLYGIQAGALKDIRSKNYWYFTLGDACKKVREKVKQMCIVLWRLAFHREGSISSKLKPAETLMMFFEWHLCKGVLESKVWRVRELVS